MQKDVVTIKKESNDANMHFPKHFLLLAGQNTK